MDADEATAIFDYILILNLFTFADLWAAADDFLFWTEIGFTLRSGEG